MQNTCCCQVSVHCCCHMSTRLEFSGASVICLPIHEISILIDSNRPSLGSFATQRILLQRIFTLRAFARRNFSPRSFSNACCIFFSRAYQPKRTIDDELVINYLIEAENSFSFSHYSHPPCGVRKKNGGTFVPPLLSFPDDKRRARPISSCC